MSTNPSRDEALFAEALDQPPAQRRAFLEQACGDDSALRARVDALLAAHDTPESLLNPPTLHSVFHASEEATGTQIGRYRLLEKIGEGGCGVVYRAEQQQPVRRQVALKVIKLGMDTQDVITRFEGERQALAMMDHPNIAKVLDAGATDAGRPYFVMELVGGTRITAFCDQHNLSTRARLKLFAQVCQAIQHAHQKGIIHRDIKPSNIIVAEHDGLPLPKVIDFGIAKATHGRLTDRTVLTAIAQFVGTPVYMSPEQAELRGVDIDTRSDIYSLGVLLYELISGRPPFDPERLISAGLDEMRRHIREVEPPRPSTRLSTLGAADRAAIAQQRSTDPAKLSVLLRGDLDWIVMRCLEKDRTRRYETASGLALDIQRFLDDQPVTASPPSAAYRFKKLVWRHKLAFAAGVAITFLLFAGSIVSTWQAFRATRAERLADTRLNAELAARRGAEKQRQLAIDRLDSAVASRQEAEVQRKLAEGERRVAENERKAADTQRTLAEERLNSEQLARAESERQKTLAEQERRRALTAEKSAQAEAEISRAVNDFLQEDLLRQADSRVQAGSGATPNPDLKVREALDRAAARVEGRFRTRPLVEAGIRTAIGKTYLGLGAADKAAPQFERTVALRKAGLGADHPGTVTAMNELATAYMAQGRFSDAVLVSREALESYRHSPHPDVPATLALMTNLAVAYRAQGRIAEAIPLAEEIRDISRREFGPEHERTLTAINNLAVMYDAVGRTGEAITLYEDAMALRERVMGSAQSETTLMTSNLAQAYLRQGRERQAEALLTRVVNSRKRLLGPEHPDTLNAMAQLVIARRQAGDPAGARVLLEETIELRRRVLGPEHPETLNSLGVLAALYWGEDRREEAGALLANTAETQTRVLGPEHPDTLMTMGQIARTHHAQGRFDEAATILGRTVEVRRRMLGPRHRDTFRSTRDLGEIYLKQRRFSEAEDLLLRNCYSDIMASDVEGLTGMNREAELQSLTEQIADLYAAWGDGPHAREWKQRLGRMRAAARGQAGEFAEFDLREEPRPRLASTATGTSYRPATDTTTNSSRPITAGSTAGTPTPTTTPATTTATKPGSAGADCPPGTRPGGTAAPAAVASGAATNSAGGRASPAAGSGGGASRSGAASSAPASRSWWGSGTSSGASSSGSGSRGSYSGGSYSGGGSSYSGGSSNSGGSTSGGSSYSGGSGGGSTSSGSSGSHSTGSSSSVQPH